MSKVIVLDCNVFAHKAIFAWNSMQVAKKAGKFKGDFIANPDYTYFKSMLSCLKKIGVDEGDIILAVVDARNSWRKGISLSYKGNRGETRNNAVEVDWDYHYQKIDDINRQLNASTEWQFIKISNFISFGEMKNTPEGKRLNIQKNKISDDEMFGIEADDIASIVGVYYPDKTVVLATIDEDWNQLTHYPNVRIFNLNKKYKSLKGNYIQVNDPLKIIAKKALKGDKSDNILVPENDTKEDYEVREFLVNLLNLPSFVIEPIVNVLDNLSPKQVRYEYLPFPNSIAKTYDDIYSSENIIPYKNALEYNKRAEIRKKNADKKKRALKSSENKTVKPEKVESFR